MRASHLDREGPDNPFPGHKALERRLGRALPHQLGSNESLDMPHRALSEALGAPVAELARTYGDTQAFDLRQQLAERLNTPFEALLVDAGADSLIALTLRTLCDTGATVVTSAGTYPTFRYFAEGHGCRLVEVAYQEAPGVLAPDVEALLQAAWLHNARLLYLVNPDNPSGHCLTEADIAYLVDNLPPTCHLLLDEAYHEFRSDQGDSTPMQGVVRLRTFSKAHGLAGLRIGYAIAAPELLEVMYKVRIHNAVSSVSLAAAGVVLAHYDEVEQHVQDVIDRREQLTAQLLEWGSDVLPSATNFLAVRLPDADRAFEVQQTLLAEDIIVHRPPHPALGHVLRISAVENALTPDRLAALKNVLQG
ncbi:pyridoxal phosphate-dependent aminotransferase [Kushneria indalinina]|uniref:Histidinol-phosphate aminotransferase n=1 Tax=Kushneria indalinina DSM 14324 TaxID=1122140 RepID=A0A3D9DSD3_9GAMM|nr:aminotransferase class I/II-fold pyridoxal phosphate-dependent enzyme [Kushneria indalinina]REC93683.1 histidinol-phosphate aminotransferase [Kushneria indalinina DSM 14324]